MRSSAPNAVESPVRYFESIAALLCASAFSSLGWIYEGEAVARLDPLAISCVSLLGGGLILLCLARFRQGLSADALVTIRSPSFLLFSTFRSALLTLLFCYCLTLTSSTKTMFLTKIEPYIVLLIQVIWYNHRTSAKHLFLLAIHVGGAVLLSTGGALRLSLDTLGDLLVFVAVTGNAVLYVPSQNFSHRIGSTYAAGFSQLFGGMVLLPFFLLFSTDSLQLTEEHKIGWYYTLLTVLVFYVISTGLWFSSIRHVPSWLASALRSFGPLFAAPIAWIWFDKPLSELQTLGAFLVVVTSAWMVVLEKRTTSRPM